MLAACKDSVFFRNSQTMYLTLSIGDRIYHFPYARSTARPPISPMPMAPIIPPIVAPIIAPGIAPIPPKLVPITPPQYKPTSIPAQAAPKETVA